MKALIEKILITEPVRNEEIGIADLDSSLREDLITLEVTFENNSTAKLIIHVQLDDSGTFTASLIDG